MPLTAFLLENLMVGALLLPYGDERYSLQSRMSFCQIVIAKQISSNAYRGLCLQASARLTALSILLLGLSSLFSDVAFYWAILIFFLQRGPIAPLSEEITEPDQKYQAFGIAVLLLGLLICLPYPFAFTNEAMTTF